MTSRRSFLRGLLALPGLAAVIPCEPYVVGTMRATLASESPAFAAVIHNQTRKWSDIRARRNFSPEDEADMESLHITNRILPRILPRP